MQWNANGMVTAKATSANISRLFNHEFVNRINSLEPKCVIVQKQCQYGEIIQLGNFYSSILLIDVIMFRAKKMNNV